MFFQKTLILLFSDSLLVQDRFNLRTTQPTANSAKSCCLRWYGNCSDPVLADSLHVSGAFTAYLVFTDKNGKHRRQQYFHSAPAMPEVLYSTAQQVVIESDGLVSFKLGSYRYRGVVDYLVTKGTPPTENKLHVEPISDSNGDGKEDWVLVYPNGERQTLFQRSTTD